MPYSAKEGTTVMNVSATTETASKPRVEGDREAEILDGVIDTLIEVGYDRMTFDAVAGRVRASKATLYRKWPTKADLVVSALEHMKQGTPGVEHGLPDTGSLAGDLTFHFCDDPDYNDKSTLLFGSVVSAIHRDPELTNVFMERFMKPRMAELRTVVERAQRRGEIGPKADLDLLASILPGEIVYRVITTGECPDEPFITQVIEQVMLPACRASVEGNACADSTGRKKGQK
ncbi:TetR/AcrR family transcriptional regulator [Flexivirga sp. B27]